MTTVCPISGLPIIQKEAWRHVQFDTEYWADYYFLGNSIMVQRAFGRVTAKGVRKVLEVEAALIKENLDETRPCIYLIDVKGLTHIEPAGRAAHRDELIHKRTNFRAVIYFHANLVLKVSIYAARKIHLVKKFVEVVDQESDAIRMALSLIRADSLTNAVEALQTEGLSTSPVISVQDAQGSIQVRYIGDAILYFSPTGLVGTELINRMFRGLINESGFRLGKPQALVCVIDYAHFNTMSSTARNNFLHGSCALHALIPVVLSMNINVSASWYPVIQISKFRLPYKVVISRKDVNLCTELRTYISHHVESLGRMTPKATRTKESPQSRLLAYLAGVSWDVPGELSPPQNVPKGDSTWAVFEALSVIKRDFDEVIQSRMIMEGDLRRLANDALAATKAKTQFLANMSHEIRTPLNGVIGMTDLMLSSPLNQEQMQWTETIQQSGNHLKEMVGKILDIAKIEAGEVKIEKVAFDIHSLLERCNDSWHYEAVSKGLKFVMDIDYHIPQQVVGDPGRLRQILFNLVGNAIKFTHEGGIALMVSLVALTDEQAVLRFVVKDTGIGIPKDRQHLLFQNFQQVDSSTTRHYGGTGLGLYLARELVTSMGGTIDMKSEPEQGSEFWFTLPFSLATHTFAAPSLTPQQCEDTTPVNPVTSNPVGLAKIVAFDPPKSPILLVEDNMVNRKVALGMLRKLGCEAEVAVDGSDALRILQTSRFSLVIMDCHMPIMDGYEATRRIRAGEANDFNRKIPIIALTASALVGDKEKCIAVGMDDYLAKPITLHALSEILARNLLPQEPK